MSDPLLHLIQTNLETARKSGSVPLSSATLTSVGATVVQQISDELGTDTITLPASAIVSLTDDGLRVSGTTAQTLLGIVGPPLDALLSTTTDASGAERLHLVLAITAADWTLATSFPQTAKGPLGRLTFGSAATFTLRTDPGPSDAYGVLEPAGLNLRASVTAASVPPLDALAPLLSLSGTLALDGRVSTDASGETLSLRAAPGSQTIRFTAANLPRLDLTGAAVLLNGAAIRGMDDVWNVTAAAEVWGATVLNGTSLVLSVSPPAGSGAWRLSAAGTSIPLARLLGLVPGLSLLGALPSGVGSAVDAEATTFAFLLDATGGIYTPVALSIEVGRVAPWTLVPGVLAIEDVTVDLDVALDGASATVDSGTVQGTLDVGGVGIEATIPIPLTGGDLLLTSAPNVAIPGIGALAHLAGGDLAAGLPSGFAGLPNLRLARLSAAVGLAAAPSVKTLAFGLGTDPWPIIPGRLVIERLWADVAVVVTPVFGVSGAIGGTLALGPGSNPPTASVAVQRPTPTGDWLLNVDVEDVVLPSLSDLATLVGLDPGSILPPSLNGQSGMTFTLVELGLQVDLSTASLELFQLQLQLADWNVVPGYFEVEQVTGLLTADFRSGDAVVFGSLSAVLAFGDGDAQLLLRAERAPAGDWTFSGTLTDDVDLIELVQKALGLSPDPGMFGALTVSPIALTYRTADETYDFGAAAKWIPQIPSIAIELDASVELHRVATGKPSAPFAYRGVIAARVDGHFGAHDLGLSVAYLFQTDTSTKSFVFVLGYDQLSLTGTYDTLVNGDEIVTVRLGGVSFGDIVTYLVNLADPDAHFALSAPWDVLNTIRFDDLSLVANLTQRSVGVRYAANVNLGLIDVGTIGLTFAHRGGSPSVAIELTGDFLGQKYTPDQPLGWDLLNDDPPTPAGQGSKAFRLEVLAVGQHLVLADPDADTMAKVIQDVTDVIVQTDTSPAPWDLVKFDPSAGWLVAADFTVMDTLRMRLVFDDPALYGVEIALSGAKAGPFAGLVFEILYRKLSDTLGVYHVALTLPDVMRHLEFGEVSVTLPNVVVDIYTDGSFALDLGFPYEDDWSVCFGLQVFPFVGSGGLAFAKLSTAAAAGQDLTPVATNGTFGPVIAFGVALALGVGKTISEGPLSAGLSVTVQGTVQGVVSWFNPTDTSQAPDRYHKVVGTVAVVGRLYGTVDFKVISVSISVVASASVSLTIESYQPILIALSVDVTVEASIKILFVRIHFSFGLHLNASFTIGSPQATPWQLDAGGSAPRPAALVARRRMEGAHHRFAAAPALLVAHASGAARTPLAWRPAPVMGATAVPIDVELMPFITPAGATPAPQVVMAAFVRTSSPSSGANAGGWRALATTADDPNAEPFNVIVRALLRWGLKTLTGRSTGTISAVDLQLIFEDLSDPATGQGGFAYSNLALFLAPNLQLRLVPPADAEDAVSRAVLPMPPPLTMAPQGQSPVSFLDAPLIDAAYAEELAALLALTQIDGDYDRANDPVGGGRPAEPRDPDEEPITEALFADWFLLVARAAVQSAKDVLAEHPHVASADDSLASLAAAFAPAVAYTVQAGDTAAAIAELFGITATALLAANPESPITPGTVLTVPPPVEEAAYVSRPRDTLASIAARWAVAAAAIEAANPVVDLAALVAGTPLRIPVAQELFAIADANLGASLASISVPLAGLRYQVRSGDTLATIATATGAPSAADVGAANADDPAALADGAAITLAKAGTNPPTMPYTTADGDTLATLAALLLVRAEPALEQAFGSDPSYGWLLNALGGGTPAGPLVAGQTLAIPNVVLGAKGLQPNGSPLTYTVKDGDTLPIVAATFVLTELRPTDADLIATQARVQAANPHVDFGQPLAPGTALTLPGQTRTVVTGDTLTSLGARFWLTAADVATVNSGAPLPAPAAWLALPPTVVHAIGGGQTLTGLAAAVGLSVDALVGRLGDVPGLFSTGTPLVIRGARQRDVDELCDLVVSTGGANSAAGQASSFLLQGLRVPDPADRAQNRALFDLTGQQFAAPAQPEAFTITFTDPGAEEWLTLDGGQVVVDLPRTGWPSTTFDPQIAAGFPKPLPLGDRRPVRHPVGTAIPWAVPTPPVLSGPAPPTGGGPVLFPLPVGLTRVGHPYALMTAPRGQQDDPVAVATYSWATWVPFTIRRVAASDGGWVAGVYVAAGADQAGAATLLGLWRHLEAHGGGATLSLAYPVASGTGLVSGAPVPAATALIKTNLSTETHSPPAMAAALAGGVAAPTAGATLAEPGAFLKLLWEATVTGSGGFYLTYETTDGEALPESVFAGGDEVTLDVLCVLADQADGDRTLHAFTTGAVVEGNLDTSRYDVFAAATDGTDEVEVATVPPGSAGFVLDRRNPSPGDGSPTADDQTRALYAMLAFDVAGSGFTTPAVVLPTGPEHDDDTAVWQYRRAVPIFRLLSTPPAPLPPSLPPAEADPYVAVSEGAEVSFDLAFRDRFGNELGGSTTVGPIAVGYYDPVLGLSSWPGVSAKYAITGADGDARLTVAVDLGCGRYVPTPDVALAAAVRAAAADQLRYGQAFYQLRQDDVRCTVTTSLDAPGVDALTSDAVKPPLLAFVAGAYVYLGSAQDVQPATLNVTPQAPQTVGGLASDLLVTPGQLLTANAAADASGLLAGPLAIPQVAVVRPSDTLAGVAAAHGTTVAALIDRNADVPLNTDLVALQTAVRTYGVQPDDTLTGIAGLEDTSPADLAVANSGTPGLLAAQQLTIAGVALTITALDTFATVAGQLQAHDATITVPGTGDLLANVAGLLVTDALIAIASSPVRPDDATGARTYAVQQGQTLRQAAKAAGATAVGLALANGQAPGVLTPTATVDVQGVSVSVAGGTFATIVEALLAKGLSVGIAAVATAVQDVDGLLVDGTTLHVTDYPVTAGDTVASVPALSAAVLALLDGAAPANVFPTGTALTVGSSSYVPQPGDTVTMVAAENGLTLEQLAAANAGVAFADGATVVLPASVVPGATRDAPCLVPHGTGPTPTLSALATGFGSALGTLGTANADMPALLAADVHIAYPGHPLDTTATSTLGSLAAQAGVGVADFVADPSVADLAGLAAPGSLLTLPLPATAGSLDDLAGQLGVRALDLASANAALAGLVTPRHPLAVPLPTGTVHVVTGDHDTLQTVVRRVQQRVPSATLADLVASCGGDPALLNQGVQVLVPPASVALDAALAEPVRVAATFAPLEVAVNVARGDGRVDPAFADATNVRADTTALVPDLGSPPDLVRFATAFEAAFATRRLKIATGPRPADGGQRVWIVDFGPEGLAQVAVDGAGARYYAVRPMSRTLVSGVPLIAPYDAETGTLGTPVTQTFTSVDLDAWLRIALDAIDLVLSPAVAAAAWRHASAAVDTIVAAKDAIAGALRDRVTEILVDETASPGALAAASEALYQRMLVSLASAYGTDAVVTYPVNVTSPFAAQVETGAADGFDALAAAFAMSPEGVAQGLARVPGILAEVAVVVHGHSYTIAAGETLEELARTAGVDVVALPGVIGVPAGTPLFAPGTSIAASPLTHAVGAGDTFQTLAAFFGADAAWLGTAVQDVAGLLTPGTTITVGARSHVVADGDTLRTVAGALATSAGAVAAADGVVDAGGLLVPGVPVACFAPAAPVAPRLSGKASARQYLVGPGDGIGEVAAWYDISAAAIASALAHSRVLDAGTPDAPVTATYAGRSTPIDAGDTLTSLVTKLGAPDVPALLVGLTLAPAGSGLLRPGVRLALGPIARTPRSDDTFATLAAFFEDDPSSFAIANQDRPDVLVPGTDLSFGSTTYTVKAGDRLTDVAGALGTTPAALAGAPGIGDRAGIFAARAVHGLQVLPDYALSAAKTSLATGVDHVAVLFSTTADATFKSLFLDVDVDIADIELDIAPVAGAGDYVSSQWLRLAVPLGTTAFGGAVDLAAGQTQVPIPLRAFPLLPSVVDLDAQAAVPAPASIADAKRWQLAASVQHQSAAQDALQLLVTFGSVPDLSDVETPPALFTALAQFVTAWPQLQSDVAALALGGGSTKLTNVVNTLATLIGAVATGLTAPPVARLAVTPPGQRYAFQLEPTIDQESDPPQVALFDLKLTSATETDDVPWPWVYLDGTGDPIEPTAQPDGRRRYVYPAPPSAFEPLMQRYVFPGGSTGQGRDAVAFQLGQSAAAVIRNADLVTTAATADAFVYQTPWVSFSAAAIPDLQAPDPIQIGTGPDVGPGLSAALTELLTYQDTSLDGTFTVRLLIRYERTLAGRGEGAVAMALPVLYIPQHELSSPAIGTLAASVAEHASTWFAAAAIEQHPADRYVIDLSLFATADPAMVRPLVQLTRLVVPLVTS